MLVKGGHTIDPRRVIVERDIRQRRVIDTSDLIDSIRDRGVLNPIILKQVSEDGTSGTLVAGERRLTCALQLGHDLIPYRYVEEVPPDELELIELEENTRRSDLNWKDMVLAYLRIYEIKSKTLETQAQVAQVLGISDKALRDYIGLGQALRAGDKDIAAASEISQAKTTLTRKQARERDNMLNEVLEMAAPALATQAIPEVKSVSVETKNEPEVVRLEPKPDVILTGFTIKHLNSIEFMQTYTGPKFNLIHCDFPYGVELNGQAQQGSFGGGGYTSNPDIYWQLCRVFAKALPRLAGVSAHVVFWISMNFYEETLEFFRQNAPQLNFNPTPLIWMKTDNKGIIPDPRRMPKNIYEAALFGSVGDRFIVKPVANAYGAPTGKAESIHTNEKPEAMLKHFLSMLVDEHTVAFDPTCGSGSAIRAVEALGGKAGLGLELNPEFADRAQKKLESARNMKMLSEKLDGKV